MAVRIVKEAGSLAGCRFHLRACNSTCGQELIAKLRCITQDQAQSGAHENRRKDFPGL